MHYYQFHISDYKSHTSHLDPIEDIVYRRLLDWYYLNEKPIPLNPKDAARLINMKSKHREVELILREFFNETELGWINKRADAEITVYKGFSDAGKRGAAKRWGKGGDSPPIAPPIATNNHKPITINHKPITPSAGFDEFWNAYPRKIGRGAALSAWNKKKPDLQKVLDAIAWQSKSDGWTKDNGKFIPHPTTWLNQDRWLDENPNDKPFDLHQWSLEVQGLI